MKRSSASSRSVKPSPGAVGAYTRQSGRTSYSSLNHSYIICMEPALTARKRRLGVGIAPGMLAAQAPRTAHVGGWRGSAGVSVPRQTDGKPELTSAVAPSFALEAADGAENIDRVPKLKRRDTVVLT